MDIAAHPSIVADERESFVLPLQLAQSAGGVVCHPNIGAVEANGLRANPHSIGAHHVTVASIDLGHAVAAEVGHPNVLAIKTAVCRPFLMQ